MLMCVSVDITNVTIQWSSIPCLQQNGRIAGYRIIYYPYSSDEGRMNQIIDSMEFTVVGLQPQTMYTFEVNGFTMSNNVQLHGPAATIMISTLIPQGIIIIITLLRNNNYN